MIFLILILALILRLINLNQSLWLDEAVQAITAKGNFWGIFNELKGDFHPPLYHIFLWVWVHLFGSGEIILRIPSVLFGVGAVWVVYKINKLTNYELRIKRFEKWKIFDSLPAILLAVSQYHIFYSQEARMYSMGVFLTAVSMFFFLKINGLTDLKIKKLDFLFYFLFTLAAIYTDYYAFWVLLVQGIWLVIRRKFKLFTIYYLLSFIFLGYQCLLAK